jgi:hypothetical protein
MGKKLTFEYVKNYFKEQRCELLEEEYVNNHTKMRYRCSCGNISKTRFDNFKQGHKCMRCGTKEGAKKQRYSFEYVKTFFRNNKCELLEKEYVNAIIPLLYKCSCNNISKIRFNDFKRGMRCRKCSGSEKHTFEYVKQYFKDNGCELLEKEYIDSHAKMSYRCVCKNISTICFHSFKQGHKCKKCGSKKTGEQNKNSYKYVYDYFKKNGCDLLEKKYKDNKIPLKYRCSCNNISKITFNSFIKGTRCRKCGTEKQSGKNNHNWNPVLTNEDRLLKRKFPGYEKWRKKVYKKNNHICQKCLHEEKRLHAHHIEGYSENKELRLAESNGVTFCEKCHIKFHKKYGKKNNNRQQLNEFLKTDIIKKVS